VGLIVGRPLGRLGLAVVAALGLMFRATQDRRLWPLALLVLGVGIAQAVPWALDELGVELDRGRARWSRLMSEAEAAKERGDPGEARANLQTALAGAGGRRPTLAAEAAERLADLAIGEERTADAARLLEQALRSRERVPGPDDPRTRATRERLAELSGRLGEHDRAVALLREQVGSVGRREGAESAGAAAARSRLGAALAAAGRDDEAEASFRQALEQLARLNGPHHWSVVDPLLGLAAVDGRRGRPAEAEAGLRRALDSASMAGQSALANRARAALIELYVVLGRIAEAVPLSEARLRSMEADASDDRSRAADLLERHARLLAKAGDEGEAARYRRRADLLRGALAGGGTIT
jgi:tetratricopeptide (TPR) repeat protein